MTRKKSTVPGASHSLLMGLWGKAVRKKWGGECILDGPAGVCDGKLEAHHIVRRHTMLTRYYVHNGVTLCQYHHGMAGGPTTRHEIDERIGPAVLDELSALERESFKDYLIRRGLTRADFLLAAKKQLLDFLGDPL